jgi:hypothetical protein
MPFDMTHRRTPLRRNYSLLPLVILCCGCEASYSDIQGKVELAGKPINIGTISFLPANGRGPTAAAKIVDGRYSLCILAGKYKVQIAGFRKTGQKHANEGDSSTPMVDILEPIVPERYNAATTLIRDIKSGQQNADFALD